MNNEKIQGEQLEYKTLNEEWNKYEAEDGTTLKFKTVVSNIIRLSKYKPNGEPIYVVKSTNLLEADVPDILKYKKHKKEEIN